MHPSEILIAEYKTAAGEAAAAEIKTRMLADKYPATQSLSHAQRLEDVEDKVIEFYSDNMTQDDVSLLRVSRRLRNKLFHADFRTAGEILNELGRGLSFHGVTRISIDGFFDLPADRAIPEKIHPGIGGL